MVFNREISSRLQVSPRYARSAETQRSTLLAESFACERKDRRFLPSRLHVNAPYLGAAVWCQWVQPRPLACVATHMAKPLKGFKPVSTTATSAICEYSQTHCEYFEPSAARLAAHPSRTDCEYSRLTNGEYHDFGTVSTCKA
jgi:hypothetical protein